MVARGPADHPKTFSFCFGRIRKPRQLFFLEMAVGYFRQLARSYLRLVLGSCLSYIFLIYPIFSQTVQSLSLILWLRVFYLIVNEISLTGSDNDGFLDILNDSLEESDIGSASDSDYLYMNALIRGSGGIVSVHGISKSHRKMCEQEHITYIPEGKAQEVQPDMPKRPLKYGHENEIKALLGFLLLAGVFQSNRLNLCDVYSTDGTGVEIFSSTMSLQRLRFLLRCLRFDDHATRSERKRHDKLAAIRMVFDTFVRNCTENYMHSAHVTIDEVLVSFKGRCPFRMYIPSKAAKYGIKIFELSDSETYYVSKVEVYVGKQNEGPHQMDTSPAAVVKRLCSAIVGTGRNITMDNWFMSYSLVEDVLKEKLTAVGTMRKNKRQIPAAFIDTKHREQNSSLFGYQKNVTLVSYVPKKIRTSYY
ncbi:PiggyBac transposable element-derived protein 4 [Trichinella spiralis]|uniref:PiggyBac transposable element-derived protein 4 n=1 Tax=Trichinella spiralis TaxID=6334 RepID=A0A0V1BTN8_TRISP|nr:PiggyBac transposable element-derived protein 4 [Trichinella spiralis]